MSAPYQVGVLEDGSIISYIRIDFEKNTADPARIFRSTAELIDAFYAVESDLARSINADIRPIILLEEIQSGSVLVWLRTILENTSDEALLNLDWKPLVGQFLVKGKKQLLEFISDKCGISSADQIEALQLDLDELNPAHLVAQLPLPTAVPAAKLLSDCKQIADALNHLAPSDKVSFVTTDCSIELNKSFSITSEQIETLLTKTEETYESDMYLKVKKPDYLGASKWGFKYSERAIEAKIEDKKWLSGFQSRSHDVRPGDSIRARVRVSIKRDQNDYIVAERFTIVEVIETIQSTPIIQSDLISSQDEED